MFLQPTRLAVAYFFPYPLRGGCFSRPVGTLQRMCAAAVQASCLMSAVHPEIPSGPGVAMLQLICSTGLPVCKPSSCFVEASLRCSMSQNARLAPLLPQYTGTHVLSTASPQVMVAYPAGDPLPLGGRNLGDGNMQIPRSAMHTAAAA